MYRSPNVYWKNYSSFVNVLAVFQQYSLKNVYVKPQISAGVGKS